jgi:UMF1 family MFS transporter
LGLFLLSYFLFDDAIITASTNFPIYLQNVFNISDSVKSAILLEILITSSIGAFCSGWFAGKIGLKKALMIILAGWVVLFPLLALTYNLTVFIILSALMGFLFGSVWTVTRATMTVLCPKEKLSFGFSFYTLAERASTFVGPLGWGIVTSLFLGLGSTRYRIALIGMAVFVAVGLFFLKKAEIKEDPAVIF